MANIIVCVTVDLTDDAADPAIGTYTSFLGLQIATRDTRFGIVPIYKFGGDPGKVEVDFRKMSLALQNGHSTGLMTTSKRL